MTCLNLARGVAAVAVLVVAADAGAQPRPQSLEGWMRYVAAVEQRRAREDAGPRSEALLAQTMADRRAAIAGTLVVTKMVERDGAGRALDAPSAQVHHWRGMVFLPGVDLRRLITILSTEAPPTSPEVLRAAVLARGPDVLRVALRLQRTKIVTVVYDTEHDVRFFHDGPTRARSTSVATRIAELQDVGTAKERERPVNEDRGFLWRLNAYWRYEAVPGGVIAECESVSLSRRAPLGLQTIAAPIISSTAKESMERTLESLRAMGTAGAVSRGR